jgi:hypothetical protein
LAALRETIEGNSMTENEIATIVVDAWYHIHTRLWPGLLECLFAGRSSNFLPRLRLNQAQAL